MTPTLVFVTGPQAGKTVPLTAGKPLVIGRSPGDGLTIADTGISRRHCQVELSGHKLMLSDMGSTNGTYVDGQRIEKLELEAGHSFQIGQSQVEFSLGEAQIKKASASPAKGGEPASAGAVTALAGKALGQFAIKDIISRGATGVVFRATDNQHNTPVALKVLWPEFLAQEEDLKRLVRSVKTMIPIRHPNLVSVYGAGKTEGLGWVSMELVEGKSVAQILRKEAAAGKLEWQYAFQFAVQVAQALEELHTHEIVHRNLTPRHILVRGSDKVVKLGDLALAKALSGTMAIPVTRSEAIIGETAFMSPEQTFGPGGVDIRSDIYGLGATLYAMLAGRPPFEAASETDLLLLVRGGRPAPIEKVRLGVPVHLIGVIDKMLARLPEDRFETPKELLKALERVRKFTGLGD